jgi:4'-phosphopantetheinyl transferase
VRAGETLRVKPSFPSPETVLLVRFDLDGRTGFADPVCLLDADERDRAARFIEVTSRRRYIVAHAMTRFVLGQLLSLPPASVRLSVQSHGKPQIDDAPVDVRFNVSHSGGRALLAVTLGREVGVDVEQERSFDALDLARRFFSHREYGELARQPAEQQVPLFFRCWVRKESLVKALGVGLSLPLDDFAVDLGALPAHPVLLGGFKPSDAGRWTIVPIDMEPGYAAAVTVEGSGWKIEEVGLFHTHSGTPYLDIGLPAGRD